MTRVLCRHSSPRPVKKICKTKKRAVPEFRNDLLFQKFRRLLRCCAVIVGCAGACNFVGPFTLAVGEGELVEVAAGRIGFVIDVLDHGLAVNEDRVFVLDRVVVLLNACCRRAPEVNFDFQGFTGGQCLPQKSRCLVDAASGRSSACDGGRRSRCRTADHAEQRRSVRRRRPGKCFPCLPATGCRCCLRWLRQQRCRPGWHFDGHVCDIGHFELLGFFCS